MKRFALCLRILVVGAAINVVNVLAAPTIVTGCTPHPITPSADADAASANDAGTPSPDAAELDGDVPIPPGTPAGVLAGCANLRKLGCAVEGKQGICEAVNAKVLADRLTALGPPNETPMACVGAAKSGADVRSCAPTWRAACQGH